MRRRRRYTPRNPKAKRVEAIEEALAAIRRAATFNIENDELPSNQEDWILLLLRAEGALAYALARSRQKYLPRIVGLPNDGVPRAITELSAVLSSMWSWWVNETEHSR